VRARIRQACDGLGYFLGPAAMLVLFAVLNLLLILDLEASVNEPLHLNLASWFLIMVPTGLALGLIGYGVARRHIERNPRPEEFGFGHGIDPEFIERRLSPGPLGNPTTPADAQR
jgi:hypothetical protein